MERSGFWLLLFLWTRVSWDGALALGSWFLRVLRREECLFLLGMCKKWFLRQKGCLFLLGSLFLRVMRRNGYLFLLGSWFLRVLCRKGYLFLLGMGSLQRKFLKPKKPCISARLFLWCHRKMSSIFKWLYIFILKKCSKRNLPLLLHLSSESLFLSSVKIVKSIN